MEKTAWEERMEAAAEHFGYTVKDLSDEIGPVSVWETGHTDKRLRNIPDMLTATKLDQHRFRLILDYDPQFPDALFHIRFFTESEGPSR